VGSCLRVVDRSDGVLGSREGDEQGDDSDRDQRAERAETDVKSRVLLCSVDMMCSLCARGSPATDSVPGPRVWLLSRGPLTAPAV